MIPEARSTRSKTKTAAKPATSGPRGPRSAVAKTAFAKSAGQAAGKSAAKSTAKSTAKSAGRREVVAEGDTNNRKDEWYHNGKKWLSKDEGQSLGVLLTSVEVPAESDYESCTLLEVKLTLHENGRKRARTPGTLTAWLINMEFVKDEEKPSWMKELLIEINEDEAHELDEIRRVFGVLYDKNGALEETLDDDQVAKALNVPKIVLIKELQLNQEFHGTGLVDVVLESFREIVDQDMDVRTIVLSPAKMAGSRWEGPEGEELNDVQIEAKLIGFYRKCKYDLWIQGNPDVENSVSVMGQLV